MPPNRSNLISKGKKLLQKKTKKKEKKKNYVDIKTRLYSFRNFRLCWRQCGLNGVNVFRVEKDWKKEKYFFVGWEVGKTKWLLCLLEHVSSARRVSFPTAALFASLKTILDKIASFRNEISPTLYFFLFCLAHFFLALFRFLSVYSVNRRSQMLFIAWDFSYPYLNKNEDSFFRFMHVTAPLFFRSTIGEPIYETFFQRCGRVL